MYMYHTLYCLFVHVLVRAKYCLSVPTPTSDIYWKHVNSFMRHYTRHVWLLYITESKVENVVINLYR